MKKVVTEPVEKINCDFCGGEAYEWNHCLNCGKHLCYDCIKTFGKKYSHGVYISGSGDGLYCKECDARLIGTNNPLHTAYRAIDSLSNEYRAWSENFEKRRTTAEAHLWKLNGKTA